MNFLKSNSVIYVFDDDTDMLEILTRVLSKQAQVKAETNPWILLEENFNDTIDLIIMDQHFGHQDSLELIGTLKKTDRYQRIPLLLHSGGENLASVAKLAGADGYLRKPSSIAEIRFCVQHYLDSSRMSGLDSA